MDRQWMYADRWSKEFIDGVHYFLRVAEANRHKGFICCPCNKCKNQKEYSASRTIHFHLFELGFMSSYNCWTSHGEQGVEMEEDEVEDDNIPDFAQYAGFEGNQTGEEEKHADGNDVADDLGQMLQDAKEDCESEKGAHKLNKMFEDHRTLLYPGYEQGHKKLDTTLEFLRWKAGVSDKAFGDLLKLIKNILPEGNKLPKTTYEAKKIVCPLGLEVQKIHTCPNDCIVYRGEKYENLEACPVCKALRYKIRRDDPGEVDGQLTKKRIPAKLMCYFPIIPRLRRLFRNKGNARMMRWHAEELIIRGILLDNIRATITKLCSFMNAISQKVIDLDRLEALQNDVVQCLVSFELIFPPSFFNIMTHLLCHLVKEIGILGPVYLHNMFHFKRYMGVLRKYVRNCARPEASIAKGYGTEEVIEFCVEFIKDLRPIGVPESRHEGRLRGKGTFRRKAIMTVDNNLFYKAHFTVLQQSSLVAPYIEEHLALVRATNIGKSDALITRHHIDTFPAWLRQHLMGNEAINQQVAFLARGPSGSIATFQGYEINGYTFYTRTQDMKSTNQNSAVRIDAMGHDGTTGTYYGAIEEIWELGYGPLNVPLFPCQWVRLTGGGVTIDDSGMITVDLNKDMSSKRKKGKGPDEPKRHVVLPGKRKIVGVEDKTDEDYDQFDGQPPFTVTIDPSILLSNEDTPYSRSDHKEGTVVRRKYVRTTVTADVLP
uniref:OSIGBa0097A15.6 protein n=1 Tax=Oryza sativa TaxID=4530 RepID=Q01KN0_ORYSA|nr:OSIGBa0097A15.6 [Oryza sativa]